MVAARMLGFRGPAQPSPMLSDARNAGFRYLEIRYAGCNLHFTIAPAPHFPDYNGSIARDVAKGE